ncbi:MAG: hypothetical protein LZ173_09680 [Thaumarchaeota archaeon]|jgi:hypothetical protein|nr:hypothetical protein [Candidatus Geocrenenecus arthurdayi]
MSESETSGRSRSKRSVFFVIDEDLYSHLKIHSAETGMSMTEIVQRALEIFFGIRENPPDIGIQELAKLHKVELPEPRWDDEELVKWIHEHQKHEVYDTIRVLIREGGSFRDFGLRIFELTKTADPSKYQFILHATQKYAKDIYAELEKYL